eukprot:PhM_4_TR4954/c0_g1_i1/m.103200/K07918/RAB32; Ras-related protein Rab-32
MSTSPIKNNLSYCPPIQQTHVFKLLVLGDLGVGKSSLIKRYVHDIFTPANQKPTIGVDFNFKEVVVVPGLLEQQERQARATSILSSSSSSRAERVSGGGGGGDLFNFSEESLSTARPVTVRIQIWDIAGQERFSNMTRVYYTGAVGALILFDVTRFEASMAEALKWKHDFDAKVSSSPCVLVANKSDLLKGGKLSPRETTLLHDFCVEHGFETFAVTSARQGTGVEEVFVDLTARVYRELVEKREKEAEAEDGMVMGDEEPNSVRLSRGRHEDRTSTKKRAGPPSCSC